MQGSILTDTEGITTTPRLGCITSRVGIMILRSVGLSMGMRQCFSASDETMVNITYLWGIKAELSTPIIVLYQHKGWNSSLHYVVGIKTGSDAGGRFIFYNDSYYRKKYNKNSISIWKYIDLLKENGCKLIKFWGVYGKKGWW